MYKNIFILMVMVGFSTSAMAKDLYKNLFQPKGAVIAVQDGEEDLLKQFLINASATTGVPVAAVEVTENNELIAGGATIIVKPKGAFRDFFATDLDVLAETGKKVFSSDADDCGICDIPESLAVVGLSARTFVGSLELSGEVGYIGYGYTITTDPLAAIVPSSKFGITYGTKYYRAAGTIVDDVLVTGNLKQRTSRGALYGVRYNLKPSIRLYAKTGRLNMTEEIWTIGEESNSLSTVSSKSRVFIVGISVNFRKARH